VGFTSPSQIFEASGIKLVSGASTADSVDSTGVGVSVSLAFLRGAWARLDKGVASSAYRNMYL